METYGVIYILRNTMNGKCYVGQHVGLDVHKRWKQHQSPRSGCIAIRNAIQKYGWGKFEASVIETCVGSQEDLDVLECYFIKHYSSLSPGEYNLTHGGRGGIPSDETKAKMSLAMSGENNHLFGKTHSDEARAMMSLAKIGKTPSDETKAKISLAMSGENNPMSGKSHSDEAKKKMSGENHYAYKFGLYGMGF